MIEELKSLNLKYYERKAVEILLKEKLNLKELSKKAGIPFGKIYSTIKSLKEKGLIKETNSRPKLIYIDNASDIISKLINEKQKRDNLITESLREIAAEIDNKKGKETNFFQIGVTQEDNKRIQLRTFDEAKEEVLQILNIYHKPKSNRESKTIWEKAKADAIKRGITFKTIYPKKIVIPKIIQNLHKKYPNKFRIKRIDTVFVRCDIIDSKKVLIKLVQEDPMHFGGVLFIESEKLAENLKKIFYELWEEADN